MQPFSDAFKARVVQRLVGPRAVSANVLAEEVGVSQEALSRWLRAARRVGGMTSPSKKQWTGAEKLRVVTEARDLSGSALGAFLRREGLHEAQLAAWRAAAEAAFGVPTRPRPGGSPEAQRIRELERELRRKDKALAETAALLVLKNKVQAIWGDEDDPRGLLTPGRTLGSGAKEGFRSKETDAASQMDYFGARYYLPAIGRFGAADPQAAQFAPWSTYAYSLNDPAGLIDPDGKCARPPGLKAGQVGICIGSYISAKRIGGVGLGDNRGPVADNPTATLRAQVQLPIDPRKGSIESSATKAVRSSVFFDALGRTGTATTAISNPTVDKNGTTRFTVTTTALDGLSFLPTAPKDPIDVSINFVVTKDGKVGIAGGARDAYPSLEVFSYDAAGRYKEILVVQEQKPRDLKAPMEQQISAKVPQQ